MPKPDDRALCQQALDAYVKLGNSKAAGLALGVPTRTLLGRVHRAQILGLKTSETPLHQSTSTGPVTLEPAEKLVMDRKARQDAEAKRELKAKLDESERQREFAQKSLDLMIGVTDNKAKIQTIPKYTSKGGQGIFVGVASDWHIEEDVTPGSIPGYVNEYNPDIAKARSQKFFQSYVFMLDAWRHVGSCDTAVLAVLGDIITGYIHEELMESNHMSPTQAILFGQELLGSGIEYILKHSNLKQLIIPWCYGNHGRTTVKSRIHTGADNSFEYLLGRTMEREWQSEKRIHWEIAEGYHKNVDLFDFRIRFHHGDAIGYGGGIGGITIPVRKKILNWNQGSPKPAHLDVFGHFHQCFDGGNFVSNGSLIGFNAFALQIGAVAERARQACFWIDSQRGKTMFGELYCEAQNPLARAA